MHEIRGCLICCAEDLNCVVMENKFDLMVKFDSRERENRRKWIFPWQMMTYWRHTEIITETEASEYTHTHTHRHTHQAWGFLLSRPCLLHCEWGLRWYVSCRQTFSIAPRESPSCWPQTPNIQKERFCFCSELFLPSLISDLSGCLKQTPLWFDHSCICWGGKANAS